MAIKIEEVPENHNKPLPKYQKTVNPHKFCSATRTQRGFRAPRCTDNEEATLAVWGSVHSKFP